MENNENKNTKKIKFSGYLFYILFILTLTLAITLILSRKSITAKVGIKNVAVIDIEGAISYKSGLSVVKAIRKYGEQNNIRAIVFRINSPGGTVGGTQEIYREILRFRKKGKVAVASFGDVAASGGFYIAMACDHVVSNPGTLTGSIGVIINTFNFSNLAKRFGVERIVIKAGRFKDILNAFRGIKPEEYQLLQNIVNDTFADFYKVVKKSRKKIPEDKLKQITDGRIFNGNIAHKLKLVDSLGGYYEAIQIAKKLAKIPGKANIIVHKTSSAANLLKLFQRNSSSIKDKFLSLFLSGDFSSPVLYLYTGI